jgi:hypothetical protein
LGILSRVRPASMSARSLSMVLMALLFQYQRLSALRSLPTRARSTSTSRFCPFRLADALGGDLAVQLLLQTEIQAQHRTHGKPIYGKRRARRGEQPSPSGRRPNLAVRPPGLPSNNRPRSGLP